MGYFSHPNLNTSYVMLLRPTYLYAYSSLGVKRSISFPRTPRSRTIAITGSSLILLLSKRIILPHGRFELDATILTSP